MKDSFRIGRLLGIEITANWSLLVTVALIAWSLAAAILPANSPDQPAWAYWAVALAVTPAFFASLLAHEFGHSLVARRLGVEVKTITLWLFGGVSKLERESSSGRDELRIAVVGPAVSIALGAAAGALAVGASALGAPDLVLDGLAWLAAMNVMLGLFNLLPAFPLDGGRVLRAALWMRNDDHVKATEQAAAVSRMLSTVLIAFGLLEFLSTGTLGGLWLAFIGWFVLQASRAEAEVVAEQELLAGIRVAAIMSSPVLTAPAGVPVEEFVERYVLGNRATAYPVVDEDGRPIGLVTLDQVRDVPPRDRGQVAIGSVAVPIDRVVCAEPAEPVVDLLPRLLASGGTRALVLDGDELVGILTATDLNRALLVGAITHAEPTIR